MAGVISHEHFISPDCLGTYLRLAELYNACDLKSLLQYYVPEEYYETHFQRVRFVEKFSSELWLPTACLQTHQSMALPIVNIISEEPHVIQLGCSIEYLASNSM
ncbi:hypothetical protein HELRODRAFT_164344 [Helobdella robusta]|uniref:Uncharacterized protein n=1 Tax=Helobdella robusta TaxID=6412 RepID=T1EVA6_HELRO|nr:hypothetical protein HELRODRAFT_164344 [Helobdella robusta]ESN94488.1 hypothetical protein HELRODRAFT_164344 [Helobdella robusta]